MVPSKVPQTLTTEQYIRGHHCLVLLCHRINQIRILSSRSLLKYHRHSTPERVASQSCVVSEKVVGLNGALTLLETAGQPSGNSRVDQRQSGGSSGREDAAFHSREEEERVAAAVCTVDFRERRSATLNDWPPKSCRTSPFPPSPSSLPPLGEEEPSHQSKHPSIAGTTPHCIHLVLHSFLATSVGLDMLFIFYLTCCKTECQSCSVPKRS